MVHYRDGLFLSAVNSDNTEAFFIRICNVYLLVHYTLKTNYRLIISQQ